MNIYLVSQRPSEPFPYIVPCVPTFVIAANDEKDATNVAREIVKAHVSDPNSRHGTTEESLQQLEEDWNGVVHTDLLGVAVPSLKRGPIIYTL